MGVDANVDLETMSPKGLIDLLAANLAGEKRMRDEFERIRRQDEAILERLAPVLGVEDTRSFLVWVIGDKPGWHWHCLEIDMVDLIAVMTPLEDPGLLEWPAPKPLALAETGDEGEGEGEATGPGVDMDVDVSVIDREVS